MSRIVDTPKEEAKKIYYDIISIENMMIDNFFDLTYRELPNAFKSREDYIQDLKKEYKKIIKVRR